MFSRAFLFLCLTLPSYLAFAQEIVSVTEEKLSLGKPYLEVTEKQIRNSPRQNVGELLADVPGFSILSSGPQGQLQSLSFRGAKSEHLLVIVNGVVMNDLASPAGAFDFSLIPTSLIEKIFVYKRGQAVRYGAGALAGAVVIQLKPENVDKTEIEIQGGSFDEKALSFSSGPLSVAAEKSIGYSSADVSMGNQETDGNESVSVLLTKEKVTFLHQQKRTEYDTFEGPGGDDPNAFTSSRQSLISYSFNPESGLSFRETTRGENNAIDALQSNTLQASYKTQKADLHWVDNLFEEFEYGLQLSSERIASSVDTNFGFENYSSSPWQNAIWLARKSKWQQSHADIGVRYDHSNQGGATSAKASFEVEFGDWLSSIEIDQTHKFPTAFQLYSSYGDRNLAAEKSVGTFISLGRNFEDYGFEMEVFDRQFTELIDFDLSTSTYKNLARVRNTGITALVKGKAAQLDWQTSVTSLQAKDQSSGDWLLRRPFLSGQLQLSFDYSDHFSVQFYSRYLGDRDDLVASQRKRIRSLILSDLSLVQKVSRGQVRLDLLNVFRERQPRVWGYTEPDLHFNLSLQQSF